MKNHQNIGALEKQLNYNSSKPEPENTIPSNPLTLREKIGTIIQVSGVATLFGDAAYIFSTHDSFGRHFLPYILLATGLALAFGGQIVKGFNRYDND